MQRPSVTAALLIASLTLTAPSWAMSPQSTARSTDVASDEEKVELNSATPEQLEALPGIGPRTAELIVEYRNESGGFKKIEELMNVRGIGERTFLRLRPLIRIDAPPER